MSKLKLPPDMIKNYILNDLENASHNLRNAQNNAYLNVPYDFTYRSYLTMLKNTLNGFENKINNIKDNLNEIDSNYQILINNLNSIDIKLPETIIKERERLIK